MPLPPPSAQRTRMHVRSVQLDGYKRSDGCWEIEARLTDVKDHDYPLFSELLMFLPTAALQTFASDVRDNDDSGHQRPIGSTVATRWSRIRTRFSAITRAGIVAKGPGRTFCPWFVTFRNPNSSKESA